MNKFKAFLEMINPGKGVTVSLCVMLAISVLYCFSSPAAGLAGGAVTLIYSAAVCTLTYRKNKQNEGLGKSIIENITKEYLLKSEDGLMMVDESGKVFWCNSACSLICTGDTVGLRGQIISEVQPYRFTSGVLSSLRSGSSLSMEIEGKNYEVKGVSTAKYIKNSCFISLHNIDIIEKIKHDMLMRRPAALLILIDNYSEATRSIGDTQKREAQTAIGSVLDKWSKELCGILKEYEKNHYLLIIEEEQLISVLETKFDILDAIKEIEIEGVTIPFTASIGAARIDGTLSEKMAVAKSALELALNRGGDQAVVKSNDGDSFFGAKLMGSNKHSRVRTRNFAFQLVERIKSSGNVIIMGHRFADHDSFGSCLGIAKLCKTLGKETHMVINIHDTNLKPIFSQMRGLTDEYGHVFTDRVSAQEYIRSDTLVIVCDVNNIRQFEAPDVFSAANDYAIIDHHRKTESLPGNEDSTYIEPSSSSASELVAEILEFTTSPGTLSQIEANLMYAGIMLDTKHFTKNAGTTTFAAAQYLRSEGCNPSEAQNLFRTDTADLEKEASFETDICVVNGIAFARSKAKKTDNGDRIAMAKAADKLLTLNRVRAAFTMCVIGDAVCVSGRSDGTFNVQVILEKLGGGGHYDAAAAQIKDADIDEVEKEIKRLCGLSEQKTSGSSD